MPTPPTSRRSAPKGIEVSVPARGSVRPLIRDMLKHLCSAISYGGARSLGELQEMFRKDPERYVIRLTESSRESRSIAEGAVDYTAAVVQDSLGSPGMSKGTVSSILPISET